LPTEWKHINKNCIILQLNGNAIKKSSFNGDIFVLKVLRGTISCTYYKIDLIKEIEVNLVKFQLKYTHVPKCMQLAITQEK